MKFSKNSVLIMLVVVFLLFLKVDFRVINELRCCQDDYDYYSHALTLVEDFDFDYSNQITNEFRYFQNNKVAPIGFFGSGLLAAPFLLIGKWLDGLFNTSQEVLTYKKLIYSFSSIFYLYLSIYFLNLIASFKKSMLTLLILGSGLSYYAFERYSMTHTYEVFTITLVLYMTSKYYSSKKINNMYSYMLPLAFLLSFLVRWTNYYVLFLPFIFYKLAKPNTELRLRKDFVFLTSSLISFALFLIHTKLIYGKILLSPISIYGAQNVESELRNDLLNNFFIVIVELISDIFNVLITQEFGIFWFSPVIFISFTFSLFLFFKSKDKLAYFFVLICYFQCFFVISLWNTTASSYGFRYLYSLIPLSIFLLSINKKLVSKLIHNYLLVFSIFGLISVLFFETTVYTQLSLEPVLNSFGVNAVYSQPEYLTGVFSSIFTVESYLKIFATSFLGSIIFKSLLIILGKVEFFNFFDRLGAVSNNQDFIQLIDKLDLIKVDVYLITLIISIVLCKKYLDIK